MSKIKLTGHASGTGVLTVTAPNTSTDRTLTLPDSTGTLLTADGDGSSLTGVGVDGISSSADATAITIDSSENVGIGHPLNTHTQKLVVKKNASATTLTSGAIVNLVNEQGAGNFASLRFTGTNQNAFLGYRDGTTSTDRRLSIGVGADSEHFSFTSNGLTFNGDTAAANALDDYEEGTWTASIHNATVSGGNLTGLYIRVGRLCHIQYYTGAMSFSNVTGRAEIRGLPFTMTSDSTAYSVFTYVHGTAVTGTSGFHGEVNGSTLAAVTTDNTSYQPWVAGTKYLMVGGTYIIKEGS